MKTKITSIVFLISLLTGLLQPVLPMVEYFMFKESIIEFLCENRNVPDSDCQGMCYVQSQIEDQQERSGSDTGVLLNLDEIPVLTITSLYQPDFLPLKTKQAIIITDISSPSLHNSEIFHPPCV